MEKTLDDLVERLVDYWQACDRDGHMPPHIEFLLNDLAAYRDRTR